MKSISELEQEIRDFITSPRKRSIIEKDRADWHKLISSLDVIGDTEQAFDSYLEIEEPATFGEKYLILYGVLQALFLQQDAVEHLSEALGLAYTIDPQIKQIREIRNDSSGHPTKRGHGKGRAFNRISRISMKRHSFTLATSYPDRDTEHTDIDVPKLIESQRDILRNTLSGVIEKLKEEEIEHREKFKDKKLVDLFSKSIGYECEKIGEAIDGDLPADFGASLVKSMLDSIESFKAELEARGILEAYDHTVGYDARQLEYPLNELHRYFDNPQESRLNINDAAIFLSYIRKNMNEFIQMAGEIDEQYSSEL